VTDPKEDAKPVVPTRQPKKKTQGIFDNLRKIPERHPVEEILGLAPAEQSPTPSTPSTPSIGPGSFNTSRQTAISPERDYTKVANSIVRNAVPAGIFGDYGSKAKEIYDYLYQQTRGAVVPKRKVRIPKTKLMRGAGIGSEVTLRKNLTRLRAGGLITETVFPGTHGGNEYEVFLPEETGLTPSTPSTPSTGEYPLSIREGVPPLESTPSTPCLSSIFTTSSSQDKTSLKDYRKNDDDDAAALAGLVATMSEVTKEITGRGLTLAESDRWRELAEVLAAELKIAAGRTTISSVPSFLAEHLRRRLWKIDKQQAQAEGRELPDQAINTLQSPDASQCPDCAGSGWHYPQGLDKGVKKCQHERLTTTQQSEDAAT
jgi:hypothetical protein